MITADQIVAHMIGDYILQSDWMANEKTKKSVAALAHVLAYVVPFLFITSNISVLLVIMTTHFAIDRWRLARYVCWFKNSTLGSVFPWAECSATGYHKDKPVWMSVWLMIIADNIIHILINGLALTYIGYKT